MASDRHIPEQLRYRLGRRSSNAAVPIPAATHKRPRSWAKQQLREENR